MLFAVAVGAANILRDIREHITNTFGGRMSRYEELCEATIARALADLEAKAMSGGFDGVIGVRIGHPKIAEGAVEVVFKEACQDLVAELNTLVPVDTGFLRASLMASTTTMPILKAMEPWRRGFL